MAYLDRTREVTWRNESTNDFVNDYVMCDWGALANQLLNQWDNLTSFDLESTARTRSAIASLIEEKHGVEASLIQNYLLNMERTLPLC